MGFLLYGWIDHEEAGTQDQEQGRAAQAGEIVLLLLLLLMLWPVRPCTGMASH